MANKAGDSAGKIPNLFHNYRDDAQAQENWERGQRGGGDRLRWDRTVAPSKNGGDSAEFFLKFYRPDETTLPVQFSNKNT